MFPVWDIRILLWPFYLTQVGLTTTRSEGQCMPYFYFGLSYRDYARDIEVWHPIPFNYVVRFMRGARFRWDRLRHRESWYDREIRIADMIISVQKDIITDYQQEVRKLKEANEKRVGHTL